ncbi:MAG: response regulator [Terriglobales bacterium]
MAKNQFSRLIILLLALVGVVQGLVTYVAYRNARVALLATQDVTHTNLVMHGLERLHSQVVEAESARRGYLLARNPRHLVMYDDAVAAVAENLEHLRQLIRDPQLSDDLRRLEPLLRDKMAHMRELDMESALRIAAVEAGKVKMDLLRVAIARMVAASERMLASRQVIVRESRERAELTLMGGSLVSFGLLVLTLLVLHREGRRRQLAEDSLRRSEEQYRALVNNIPDVPWTTDAAGVPLYIGESIEKITGYTPAELIAGGAAFWHSRVHKDDLQMVERSWAGLFNEGVPLDAQYRFHTKAGGWTWLSARAAVVSVEEGIRCTQGLASDVGARRAVEENNAQLTLKLVESNRQLEARNREVERATQLKSRFLANMSHELRTPLNAIMGFSELLTDPANGVVTDRQRRWMGHIRNGSMHLLQLINDILDLSKIEADQMEYRLESVCLNDAIPEVMAIVRPLAQARKVNLAHNIAPGLVVVVDRTRLKQIIYNLMSNAVKFTPAHGMVKIEARAYSEFVCISVSDTGLGIRREDQEIIFEEFRQVSETNKGVMEGTGLGLAITKRLVERQGGRIWLESTPGEGSRFSFTLRKGQQLEADGPAAAPEITRINQEYRILVIEDDSATKELILRHLQGEGFETLSAATASDGLQAARARRPDAIILDILLPDAEGWDLLHKLKQDAVTAEIPVILVSIVDQNEKGFTLGAAEYLVKPVSREALVRALERHLPAKPDARILIVEDETADREVLCDILGEGGYRCHAVKNGKEGLDALEQDDDRFTLVILDLMLPEMDGFEFLRRVKENKQLREIPVVVLTGKDLTLEETDFLRSESHGLFMKGDAWRSDFMRQVDKALQSRPHAVSG